MFHIPPFFLLKTFDRPKNIANPLCGLLKILFALFCAFTICGCLALAEERLGFQLSENERIMAYHNGGEILCSVFDEQMQLTAVRKLDSSNRTLWAYALILPDQLPDRLPAVMFHTRRRRILTMRQQFDRCGLEGAEAELGAVNHQSCAFLLDFFLHENLLFRLMGMKKAASFN